MRGSIYEPNMIYTIPAPEDIDLRVMRLVFDQRKRLKSLTQSNPKRWFGSLRRNALAAAIRGSNSIEGYKATADEAMAVVDNEPPPQDGYTDTWLATKGYRDALTYIMQAAEDPTFEFSKQFLKSLHFMMVQHEMDTRPGQWRHGSIFVVESRTNQQVYEGPPPENVDGLIEELVEYLKNDKTTGDACVVKAALAHLNLAMIHPFKDGNGRMSRALQTLIIAQDGLLHPVYSSIEEWLGDNTEEYYRVLADVGQGAWNPQNPALPWVRFCLKAHYQQGTKFLRRYEEAEKAYAAVKDLVAHHRLPERSELPLFDVVIGGNLTNSRYRLGAEVTEYVASRDLRRLSELNIIEPQGEARGRFYRRGPVIEEIRRDTKIMRPLEDPYDIARSFMKDEEEAAKRQPRLPGM